MKFFSHEQRSQSWNDIEQTEYDLVILGGGITGAGVARDAASRGMKVLLVEQQDFAEGTSSRSSKLIHGGIRYLENMEFKLVFEALSERTKLFEMAPHLVHPLRFMIPLYEDSRVGMFKMGLGMWLYDALALFQAPQLHERLAPTETLTRMPLLRAPHLKGSFVYSDAYMDDDRLVLETLRSAHEMGMVALNYVKALSVEVVDGKIRTLRIQDQFSKKEKQVRGRHFVGSVGPWTDVLGPHFFSDWKKVLRPTKGIHITIAKDRLPLSSAVVMAAEKSQRIVFGIPRHEMVIIGTTDTDFQGDPSQVVATPEDVRYLLHTANQYFPGAQLTVQDIIATYAGVRPLVYDGSASEGKTSREHLIWNHGAENITFIAGGKYTTYRLMAHEVVEKILRFFAVEDRARFARADTEKPLVAQASTELFNQALVMSHSWAERFARPVDQVTSLCQRYGLEALDILERCPRSYTYWQLEADQAIQFTMCLNLVDFYTRRGPLILSRRDHGLGLLAEILEIFRERLGWASQKCEDEKNRLQAYIQKELAWQSKLQ